MEMSDDELRRAYREALGRLLDLRGRSTKAEEQWITRVQDEMDRRDIEARRRVQ